MTARTERAPGAAYEGAGRQVATALRGCSSVIVTSDDIVAAAHTAIGIALAESAHRLVMVADLGGETPPLQALVREDDPHGIYDSFEFGTSFVRIGKEVEGAKNFFVMPSGTESPVTEQIIGSPRWRALASDFARNDELLLLVMRSDAPGIGKLARQVDGAILVGVHRVEAAPGINILARVPHPAVIATRKIELAPYTGGWSPVRAAVAAIALLAIGIAAGALLGRKPEPARHPVAAARDSARADTVLTSAPVVVPANAADSSAATPFSVEILASNTLEGANFEIQRHASMMPAATISIVPIGDTEATWYKVHAGAYEDSAAAEKLLATLRRRGVVTDSSSSRVVRAPFAMLLDSIPEQAGMRSRIREKLQALSEKDVHAYALLQADGSARVYAGAFEQPRQSSLAATALRVAGFNPVLVYRTGRLP